jgi:iron-sulfur cluster assembly 2
LIPRSFSSDPESKTTQLNDLKLSASCVSRLKEICTDGSFLRVIVEGGGCSGFQYKFDIDSKLENDDLTFGPKEARVVVDSTSIAYIAGSTVDYHKELIRAGFRIIGNAQADHGCSCGASFSLKLDN